MTDKSSSTLARETSMAGNDVEEKGRAAAQKSLDQVTLIDPDVIECPYHTYKKLREEAPVYKDPVAGFYIVSCYNDIMKVIKDTATFSSNVAEAVFPPGERNRAEEFGGYPSVPALITADPPKHKYYRNPINKVFSAARVEQMEPYIEQITHALIDDFIKDGYCEFVAQYTIPMPLMIIADQLGVPREDLPLFKEFSDALTTQVSGVANREQRIWAAKKNVEFQKYFVKVIEEKRVNPTDDIITDLINAQMENGEPMSVPELLSVLNILLAAGNETTTNSISKGILLLIQNPDQMKLVLDDLSLVENLTEEVLRFDGPVQGLMRVATRDAEIAGASIPKGSVIMLRYASANRDEQHFPGSEAFDIRRKNAATHLAFGQGIHFCLGAMLARKEMNVTFRAVLTRMKNLRLAPGYPEPHHEPSIVLRGLKELHLAFDPAP